MPTCRKCKLVFPNHMIIRGRERNLQRRRFCLKCSPFGRHNTRARPNEVCPRTPAIRKCACEACGRHYDYERRRGTSSWKGHSKTRCNSCVVNARRPGIKQKAVDYKGGKCQLCGYSKCLKSLTFHHRDSTKKSFGISCKGHMSWQRMRKELDKCVLLCANCHGEVHAGEAGLPKVEDG